MKSLTRWTLALLTLSAVAGLSGAWTATSQATQKPARQARRPNAVARAQKHASILKLLPTLKISLGDAVKLAEKETTGRAFTAGLEVTQGKPSFQVNLFVGEALTIANVDPMTQVVTVKENKKKAAKEATPAERKSPAEGKEDQ